MPNEELLIYATFKHSKTYGVNHSTFPNFHYLSMSPGFNLGPLKAGDMLKVLPSPQNDGCPRGVGLSGMEGTSISPSNIFSASKMVGLRATIT